MTHKELQADLAQVLQAQKRLVLQEVDLCSRWANTPISRYHEHGTSWRLHPAPGAPRVDVLRVEESYTKFEVWAYEVKATRSDFLSDMRSEKWRQYLPYSHRLVFAVDYGVCAVDEVPPECGVIMRRKSGRGWQTQRQAPRTDDLSWGADTFLAVVFSMRRQPRSAEQRERQQRNAEVFARQTFARQAGHELAWALSRARRLLREEQTQSGDWCTKCGLRITPYEHERRAEQRKEGAA